MLNIVCIPGMPLPFLTSVTLCHYKRERKLFFFLLALGLRIDVNNPQGPFYVGQGLFQECPSQTSSISIRIPSSSFLFSIVLVYVNKAVGNTPESHNRQGRTGGTDHQKHLLFVSTLKCF